MAKMRASRGGRRRNWETFATERAAARRREAVAMRCSAPRAGRRRGEGRAGCLGRRACGQRRGAAWGSAGRAWGSAGVHGRGARRVGARGTTCRGGRGGVGLGGVGLGGVQGRAGVGSAAARACGGAGPRRRCCEGARAQAPLARGAAAWRVGAGTGGRGAAARRGDDGLKRVTRD
jgi:hypothetical protein